MGRKLPLSPGPQQEAVVEAERYWHITLWVGPTGGGGYSSPQLATINGIDQVLLLNAAGVMSVAPADGKLLWKHPWQGDGIVQPTVLAQGNLLRWSRRPR